MIRNINNLYVNQMNYLKFGSSKNDSKKINNENEILVRNNNKTATNVPSKRVVSNIIAGQNAVDNIKKSQKQQEVKNTTKIEQSQDIDKVSNYKNTLKTDFHNNNAKIMGIAIRTFNAKDENGNELIDENEQSGTFLNAIDRLDEIKALGINTLHVLPPHPTGKKQAMGTAGSLYSPLDFLQLDPMLDDPNDPRSVKEECKEFINECHKRGIKVMFDLPSCASYEMFLNQPELMAIDEKGVAITPQGWNDIRMLQPFDDKTKRTLNPKVLQMHKDYIDMLIDLGVDGVRADVSRAKPTEFWDILIPYSRKKDPEFAWLAETYTYEDASPQLNMEKDRPEDALRAGFDAYYGQYHIFHEWTKASELIDYVVENLNMTKKLKPNKSLIGSFGTHDDISLMYRGGTKFTNLVSGLQSVLPMTNPYILDGYQSGDYYDYKYRDKLAATTFTDSNTYVAHAGKLDIFNLSRKPGGEHPELGEFFSKAMQMRDEHKDVITKGSFIPLKKEGDVNDQIITFARHYKGKTLLVIANRDVNNRVTGIVKVPGLKKNQKLVNLLPTIDEPSKFKVDKGQVKCDLGTARVHVFEIKTPNIEKSGLKVYRQKQKV